MRFIKCHKCGLVWLYEGTGQRAACPNCNLSIRLYSPKAKWPRFDLHATPASVAAMDPRDRVDLVYLYIDLWNGHINIGAAMYSDDGNYARIRLMNPTKFWLTPADLEMAVNEAGANLDMSGAYPLNDAIREAITGFIDLPEEE